MNSLSPIHSEEGFPFQVGLHAVPVVYSIIGDNGAFKSARLTGQSETSRLDDSWPAEAEHAKLGDALEGYCWLQGVDSQLT